MPVVARPVYIGPLERRAFAWIHDPVGAPRGVGVVLCPPFGFEAIITHRALRHLADRLAQSGFVVARLDYVGTGDSDGVDDDAPGLESWIANVGDAAVRLHEEGATEIALFGMRFSALLAARAALSAIPDLAALVLYAPPPSGRAYIRELRAARALAAASGFDDGATKRADPAAEEANGFVMWGPTAAAVSAIDLAKWTAAPARRVLVLDRDDVPGGANIVTGLRNAGASVDLETPRGYAELMRDPHEAVVPTAAWSFIAEWLVANTSAAPGRRTSSDAESPKLEAGAPVVSEEGRWRHHDVTDEPGAVEEPVTFGPDRRLFGILASPLHAIDRSRAIVLLNAGAVHRVGSNRMYVLWSRAWAAQGFTVLRMDLAGIGDSPALNGGEENVLYTQDAVADVAAAVEFLRERGIERVLLCGLCSGAYVSYQAARSLDVDAAILINPQILGWTAGEVRESEASLVALESAHYRRALAQPDKWRKLVRGKVDLGYVAKVAGLRVRDVTKTRIANLVRRFAPAQEVGPAAELRSVAERVRLDFVFSVGDPGVDYLARHAGEELRRLREAKRIGFQTIDGADHTFTLRSKQYRLFNMLSGLIAERRS